MQAVSAKQIAAADIAASVAKVSDNPVFATVGSAEFAAVTTVPEVEAAGHLPGVITSQPGTLTGGPLAPPVAVGVGTPGAFDPIRYANP
jgi:hypothetical protein